MGRSVKEDKRMAKRISRPARKPGAGSGSRVRRGSGRQPRPDIVHTSVYLPEAYYEALRATAFNERCKIHDLLLEGVGLALRKRGYSLR